MSSLHLLLGLPLSRFPSLGVHSDVIFAHLVFFILVNKNIKDRVVEYRGDSSRVASLTIKINAKYHLQIVQVYAPTSTHEDEEVEEFFIFTHHNPKSGGNNAP